MRAEPPSSSSGKSGNDPVVSLFQKKHSYLIELVLKCFNNNETAFTLPAFNEPLSDLLLHGLADVIALYIS